MPFVSRALRCLAWDISRQMLSNLTEAADETIVSNSTVPPMPYKEGTFGAINYHKEKGEPLPHQALGMTIFWISITTSLLLVFIMILREYFFKRYGLDLCPLFSARERNGTNRGTGNGDPQVSDRAFAEQVQRQWDEDEYEAERLVKRKERRRWYDYYLQPYSMTVESKDIFYAHEMGQDSNDEDADNTSPESLQDQLRRLSDMEYSEDGKIDVKISANSFDETDDEEVSETAKPPVHENHDVEPVLCRSDEEDAHRYVRLPIMQPSSKEEDGSCVVTNHRHVDGQCALCIEDYDVGDQVVWSDLECPHAFHKECIMQWLCKGKKRCPICRSWFVPGTRIDDQKKLHGEEWERVAGAYEQQQQEEEEQIVQDTIDLEQGNNNNSSCNDVDTEGEQRLQPHILAPSTTEELDNDVVPTSSNSTTITIAPLGFRV